MSSIGKKLRWSQTIYICKWGSLAIFFLFPTVRRMPEQKHTVGSYQKLPRESEKTCLNCYSVFLLAFAALTQGLKGSRAQGLKGSRQQLQRFNLTLCWWGTHLIMCNVCGAVLKGLYICKIDRNIAFPKKQSWALVRNRGVIASEAKKDFWSPGWTFFPDFP